METKNSILTRKYFTLKKGFINIIAFDKTEEFSKDKRKENHYVDFGDKTDVLIAFCDCNGINYHFHGEKFKQYENGTVKTWNFITLSMEDKNGVERYLTGQSFHRVLTTALQEAGFNVKPQGRFDEDDTQHKPKVIKFASR